MSVTRENVLGYFEEQKQKKTEPSERMKFIINNKDSYLTNKTHLEMFSIESGVFCAKNCFKFMETPQVTDSEIECMQNCYAKSMELKFRFDLLMNQSTLQTLNKK